MRPASGPWCAYFVSWAAREAGVPIGDAGQGFGRVDDVWAWAQSAGKAIPAGSGQPQPGDLIVWDEHIGIVESVGADGSIHTIEGNSSDRVSAAHVRRPTAAAPSATSGSAEPHASQPGSAPGRSAARRPGGSVLGHRAQVVGAEPAVVVVRRVAEAVGQRRAARPRARCRHVGSGGRIT